MVREEDAARTSNLVSNLKPGLYLVATPIGNLGDITLRALEVLRGVDRIACEDTRQTQKLLNHFQIEKKTVSCHEHNERSRATELIQSIKAGTVTAVGIWLVVSWGFGLYAVSMSSYALYYGSLAAVAVMLVWLYLTSLSLVIGAQVNAQLEGAGRR